ncbi:MAG: hypothetical protein K2Z81_13300 [Cyanobacteria bacterium]|nr:hypothetical protein [Cyanobacteriota bacterium]
MINSRKAPLSNDRANNIEAATEGALQRCDAVRPARGRFGELSPGAYDFENYIVDLTLESERDSNDLSFDPAAYYFDVETLEEFNRVEIPTIVDIERRIAESANAFIPEDDASAPLMETKEIQTRQLTRTVEIDTTVIGDRATLGQTRQPTGTVEIALKGPAGVTVSRSTMVREFDVTKLVAEAARRAESQLGDETALNIVAQEPKGWHDFDESVHSLLARAEQAPDESKLENDSESEAVQYFYGQAEGQTYTAELRFRARFSPKIDEPEPSGDSAVAPQSYGSQGSAPPTIAPQSFGSQGSAPQGAAPRASGAQGFEPQGSAPTSFAPPAFAPQSFAPQNFAAPQSYFSQSFAPLPQEQGQAASPSNSFSMLDVIDEGYRVLPSTPQTFASNRAPDVEVGGRLSAPKKGLGSGLNIAGKAGVRVNNPWKKI